MDIIRDGSGFIEGEWIDGHFEVEDDSNEQMYAG